MVVRIVGAGNQVLGRAFFILAGGNGLHTLLIFSFVLLARANGKCVWQLGVVKNKQLWNILVLI